MEQNNYQVPIEVLPRDIQEVVQRRIQGSEHGTWLIDQIQCDRRINPVQPGQITQTKKSTIHPQKYAINEALRHVHAAWRSKGKQVRQNMRFDLLQDKQPVIPPAKFTGHYSDLERFLEDMQNYLDETEVTSPKQQVLIALSRMLTDEWVDIMRRTTKTLDDNIPYIWNHFVQQFKECVYG